MVDKVPLVSRPYTISSSRTATPDNVSIIVSIVDNIQTFDWRHVATSPWVGQCSKFLQSCPIGEKVRILPKKSTFVLPEDTKTPMIFIATGTGLAPMLAIIR